LAHILLACALAASAAATAAAEDVLKVAVPQRGAWDAGIPELGQRGGIFAKHGLKLEILYTSAGPESIQALIAGGVDIATASGVSAAFGTFAKGAPIRIIGSEIVGAPDLYWFVPAASPVKTIEDFNGKTVAFSLTGSSSHAGLLALIAQYHLNVRPTSTGSIAATITQTMTGQVDVGLARCPMRSDMAADGRIRIIASGNDVAALRTRSGRVNLTNLATLGRPQGLLKRFIAAYEGEQSTGCIPIRRRSRSTPISQKAGERDRARARAHSEGQRGRPTKWSASTRSWPRAIQNKFLAAPLTKDQLTDLIRASELQ